jgi:hypothetical protein
MYDSSLGLKKPIGNNATKIYCFIFFFHFPNIQHLKCLCKYYDTLREMFKMTLNYIVKQGTFKTIYNFQSFSYLLIIILFQINIDVKVTYFKYSTTLIRGLQTFLG